MDLKNSITNGLGSILPDLNNDDYLFISTVTVTLTGLSSVLDEIGATSQDEVLNFLQVGFVTEDMVLVLILAVYIAEIYLLFNDN
jgi:hypothetical protein